MEQTANKIQEIMRAKIKNNANRNVTTKKLGKQNKKIYWKAFPVE